VLTILHLSDLHRSQDAPVSNEMLLSCLLQDIERQYKENPAISKCDVAVITGDIIMGARWDDQHFKDTLVRQYQEATTFLKALSEELFDGDVSRVLVMPGNHDICWQICQQSMEPIETTGRGDIAKLLAGETSPYRWSWADLKLYRIKDYDLYKNRLVFFKDFFDNLYTAQGYKFSLEDSEQAVNFVLEDSKALFTGFCSLYGNDCFDLRGKIFPDCVAINGLKIRKSELSDVALKISFWHHSLESSEYGVDHLNRNEVLPLLIDQGYCLGLHGHKHKSEVLSFAYHLNPELFMGIVSSGSICGPPDAIPQGYRRQYNVIEINEREGKTKVHVREWFGNTSLTPAKLQEFGGNSWIQKELPLLKERIARESQTMDTLAISIEKVEIYLRDNRFEDAIVILRKLPQDVPIVHNLLLETLHALGKWDEIINLVRNPLNFFELSIVVAALCKKNAFDSANLMISERENDTITYDHKFIGNLRNRLEAEKKLAAGKQQ
jgi:hypothetical protein